MLGEQDLEDFFAHIDEISQDSIYTDQNPHIQKLRNENSRLKVMLSKLRSSTKEVLKIVKNERQQKLTAIQELENTTKELDKLRNSYDELEKLNVNNQFMYKESLNELENKHREEHENYVELAQDYFNVMSEGTTFYNFEIKKERNKILCKTSNFLEDVLGDKFRKPKLIVKRSTSSDSKSTASKRSRSSVKEKSLSVKKRKFDIWEMKSISEASSPMSFHEEISEETTESEYSFRTFSIGNETAFSSLAHKKFVRNVQCKCHIATKDPDLVSIGVNTDEPDLPPIHMPSFDDEVPVFSQDDLINSTVNSCIENDEPPELPEISPSLSVEKSQNIICDVPCISSPKKIETKSIGTWTENTETSTIVEKKDQSSSTVVDTCNKATSTVHSVTHRGTMTPARVTRNVGIQFPDITFEKILEEMSFELPNCINPIIDEIERIEEVSQSTQETQTDIHNVNREICYNKPENSEEKKTFLSNEEQSFIVLGQTVFNLFMNRLRETNKSLNDDAHTRERLREQLLDRFDELTFDEYFSPSFVSAEAQESVLRKVFEDVRDTKSQKKSNYEENVQNLEENAPKMQEENVENNLEELPLSQESNASSNASELTAESCLRKITRKLGEVDLVPEIEDIQEEEMSTIVPEPANNLEAKESQESIISSTGSVDGIKTFSDLDVSSESASEDNLTESPKKLDKIVEKSDKGLEVIQAELTTNDNNSEKNSRLLNMDVEVDEIFKSMDFISRDLISPVNDFDDLIWSSIFPEKEPQDAENSSIIDDDKVLDGYDIEYEPLEIPLIGENGEESPYPPPELALVDEAPYDPIEIPLDSNLSRKKNLVQGKGIEYDPKIRTKLVTWQNKQNPQKLKKNDDKRLCKIRKSINDYLNADWTDENLGKCVSYMSRDSCTQQLLVEAIYETVEDNQWQREINSEFTPPAPPLPRYQQKLILLISKLSQIHQDLPHKLIQDLEMRLFKCENSSADLEYLRNITYYYTSLIDLFFDGDPTIAFYFIIKCIYFYGYKAIPMIFVLIKAFPLALPKKSLLLKKYSTNVDWEKMTGLEMSKIRLDLEWMDSLDLCVMYLLTNIQMYRRKGQEFKVIYEHELFNYLPKMYGFTLSFIAAPKLLDVLIKRLENGELKNLSMSLILLGKRMNKDFTVRMLLKGKLLPLLKNYIDESLKVEILESSLVEKICLLIETISTILKPLTDEKDKSFKEIFPMIVNILGRSSNQKIQEYCIKAILRLQRFIENHKEIYEIIKHHFENRNSVSETLHHGILTFIHRKNEVYFKE